MAPELINIYGNTAGNDFHITNEFFESRGFRKLHIEKALFGSSFEILHSVFFPKPIFDLPIFGVDLVSTPKGISAAIVDLSPVRKKLPAFVENELKKIKLPSFKKVRQLPEWGNIFSPYVQFITPIDSKENELFFDLIDDFLEILINYSTSITPDPPDSEISIERYEAQRYYCLQQKRNDKTRNVLAETYSPAWADEYIEMVLFDCPFPYEIKN